MKRKFFLYSIQLLAIFLSCHAFAQDNPPDSLFYQKALSNTRSQFMKQIGANSYLYDGVAYERYWNRVTGHPFFGTDQFQNGTLNYGGTLYEDVPILYDMARDEVVSKTFAKNSNLALVSGKISHFTIGGHSFVRVVQDSSNNTFLNTGFYENLYQGMVTVLVKREYKIEKSLKADEDTSRFTEYDHYYIVKEGTYHAITTEGELQSLFKDQKADIRKFLNRRDMRFKKDPAKTIVQTVVFYVGLKK